MPSKAATRAFVATVDEAADEGAALGRLRGALGVALAAGGVNRARGAAAVVLLAVVGVEQRRLRHGRRPRGGGRVVSSQNRRGPRRAPLLVALASFG